MLCNIENILNASVWCYVKNHLDGSVFEFSAEGERDVFNEKPSREEIYAATEVCIFFVYCDSKQPFF